MATLAAASIATQIAVGSAVAATVTGAASYFEQKKAGREAEREQEKARETSEASAQVENARRRRRAIAQQRIAAAQNRANMSEATQSSSALTGVNSALGTQTGANIGAQRAQVTSQRQIGRFNQNAADALRTGQERAGLFNLASQGFTRGAQAYRFGSTNNATTTQPTMPSLDSTPYSANFGFGQ